MYPLPTPNDTIPLAASTTVVKLEDTPVLGSSPDQPFVIVDDVEPNAKKQCLDPERTPTSKTAETIKPKQTDRTMNLVQSNQQQPISIRLNWSWSLHQPEDIMKLSPSMNMTDFRYRVQKYQYTHHQLRNKTIAAMIVQPAAFQIVWDDDLGQSGWEELIMRPRERVEVNMEVEWSEEGEDAIVVVLSVFEAGQGPGLR